MSDERIVPDTYCAAGPGSWRGRLILRARRKMYRLVSRLVPLDEQASVLDVGVTADRACAYSNFFEAMYPYSERITAFSDQDASWMESMWPGLRFVRGDARAMPFPDNSFDFVFSFAVLEHVGSRSCQRQFLSECLRVARRDVLVTTPNRWFPVEMHSCLPLIHWLPTPQYRKVFRALGFTALAEEKNLNLLDSGELAALAEELGCSEFKLESMRFLGFKSNLLLHIRKQS